MLFILPPFTGALVGLVDGVADGCEDGELVVFEFFLPPTDFTIVGDRVATGTALGAELQAFSQPHATRKAGKSNS
jgi:hypothetical protein